MYVSDIISLNDREFDAFAKWLETSFEQIIFDDNAKRRIKIIECSEDFWVFEDFN